LVSLGFGFRGFAGFGGPPCGTAGAAAGGGFGGPKSHSNWALAGSTGRRKSMATAATPPRVLARAVLAVISEYLGMASFHQLPAST
jgi:hypothetical protein